MGLGSGGYPLQYRTLEEVPCGNRIFRILNELISEVVTSSNMFKLLISVQKVNLRAGGFGHLNPSPVKTL